MTIAEFENLKVGAKVEYENEIYTLTSIAPLRFPVNDFVMHNSKTMVYEFTADNDNLSRHFVTKNHLAFIAELQEFDFDTWFEQHPNAVIQSHSYDNEKKGG